MAICRMGSFTCATARRLLRGREGLSEGGFADPKSRSHVSQVGAPAAGFGHGSEQDIGINVESFPSFNKTLVHSAPLILRAFSLSPCVRG